MEVTETDREKLAPICNQLGIDPTAINVKMSLYKNRRGRWKGVYMWMIADRGICRFNTQFVTLWNYHLVEDIYDVKIKVDSESAF